MADYGINIKLDPSGAVSGGRTATRSLEQVERAANGVTSAVAALASALSIREIVQYADAWTSVTNKLSQSAKQHETMLDVQNRVLATANDTRTSIDATATLYGRLEAATRGTITSGEELNKIVTTVNQTMQISGATTSEAAGALVQLSQGLGAGALRGEEFNSVNEAAPRLMQAIADSLGVARGALRGYAEEGKLTADVVIGALRSQAESINSEFEKISATFESKLVVANNVATQFIGTNRAVVSAVSSAGDAVLTLANNLDTVASAAAVVGVVMVGRTVNAIAAHTAASIAASAANRAQAASSLSAAKASEADSAAKLRSAEAAKGAAFSDLNLARARLNVIRETQGAGIAEVELATAQLRSIQTSISLIESEKALEVVRLKAQISAQGRTASVTRMAELQRAASVLNVKAAAAEASAAAAKAAAIASAEAKVSASRIAAADAAGVAAAANGRYIVSQEASAAASKAAAAASSMSASALGLIGGPVGLATIAAIAVYALYQNMEQGKKEAIDYADSLDVTNRSLRNLNAAQAAGASAKLEIALAEQTSIVEDQREKVSDLTAEYERQAKTAMALFGTTRVLSDLRRQLAIEIADLDTKETALSQTKNKLFAITAQQNGFLRENYVAMSSSNQISGIAAGIQSELNSILKLGNSELEKRANYVISAIPTTSADGQKQLAKMREELELAKLSGEARARLAAVQKLGSTATSQEKAEAEQLAAQIYRLDEAQKAATKSASEQAKTAEELKRQQEANSATVERLTQQLELASLSGAELAARQAELSLNEYATAQQIEQVRQLATAITAVSDAERARDEFKQLTQQLEDPLAKLERERMDRLAIIQRYEELETASHSQAEAARAEIERQYNEERMAAVEEMFRQQSWGNELLMGTIDSLGAASTNVISGLLSGTMSVTEAMQNFANIVLNSVVGAFVDLGVEYIKNQVLASTAQATQTAMAVATGTAMASAYAPAAAMASLASFGANAAPASAGIASTVATSQALALTGFQTGGYTGDMGVGTVAGVVHGQEYVMNAEATRRIGVGNLERMASGGSIGGVNVQVHNYATGTKVQTEQLDENTVRLIISDELDQQFPTRMAGELASDYSDSNSILSNRYSIQRNTTR